MKEPTYEEFNGSVPKYLIALKKYCDYLKHENLTLQIENTKLSWAIPIPPLNHEMGQ